MSSDDASEYIASDEDEEIENERPNRWRGAPTTWTTFTAPERGLSNSLDQIRNADLSLHLYNAFALRQRAEILTQNPDVCTARLNCELLGHCAEGQS